MSAFVREVVATSRLEMGEVLRSRWLPVSSCLYAVLAAILVIFGMRESDVLGFTGMNRVMLSFVHVLVLVLPLLALTATTQVVTRAREDGTLELLFSHPLSRTGYLAALTLTRFLVLVLPLAILLVAMALLARLFFDEEIPWRMTLRAIAVSATLLWAFVGLGLAVSARTRNQARAMVWGLLLWAGSVALLDLALVGLLLQWRVDARSLFVLASVNPVQSARLALLSGVEPDLGTLGPVGFYLSHALGSRALLAIGLAWPAAVGTAAWVWALRTFRRGDLV
jgi:ABC-2 type transport system permease protein